uniref:Uncharacterized protein n=1 Tax=Zea mays TaxID=4577 RepID=A0A804NG72_MAIZE|eukprot:XP_008675287.1 uncharacterized protein LOC103651435 isoform X1 [Zea mays]
MTQHVSMISITLSPRELDKHTPGYQAPVYVEQPRQQQVPPPHRQPRRPPAQFQQLEYEDSYARGRGRGVGVEGAGVEVATVAMVDMETTKVAIIRVVGIMTIKVEIMAMIIKTDIVAMIIKVGMVVDMAITKADMGTIKKMVDITETQEVVCEEEAIGVTEEG